MKVHPLVDRSLKMARGLYAQKQYKKLSERLRIL
jgi:hypothetical protein